jgi:hypothetical protein
MTQAASKLRTLLKTKTEPVTITAIKEVYPELKASQISMALCYLMKNRYLTRQKVPSNASRGRKEIWSYTYHAEKLPLVNANEN